MSETVIQPEERAQSIQEGLLALIGEVALTDDEKRAHWLGVHESFGDGTAEFSLTVSGRERGIFGKEDLVAWLGSGGGWAFTIAARSEHGDVEEVNLFDSRSGLPQIEVEPVIKPIFSPGELEGAFGLSDRAEEFSDQPLFGFAFESQLAPGADQELLERRDTLAYLDALDSPALLGYESGVIDEYGHARSVCIWSDMSEARRLSASEAHKSAAALANSTTYDSSKIQRFLIFASTDGSHRIEMQGERIITQPQPVACSQLAQ